MVFKKVVLVLKKGSWNSR